MLGRLGRPRGRIFRELDGPRCPRGRIFRYIEYYTYPLVYLHIHQIFSYLVSRGCLNTGGGNLEKSQVFLERLLVERPRPFDEADLFYLPALTLYGHD